MCTLACRECGALEPDPYEDSCEEGVCDFPEQHEQETHDPLTDERPPVHINLGEHWIKCEHVYGSNYVPTTMTCVVCGRDSTANPWCLARDL